MALYKTKEAIKSLFFICPHHPQKHPTRRQEKKTSEHPNESTNAPHKRKNQATRQKRHEQTTTTQAARRNFAPILPRNTKTLISTPPKQESATQAKFKPFTSKSKKERHQAKAHPNEQKHEHKTSDTRRPTQAPKTSAPPKEARRNHSPFLPNATPH